MRHDLKVLQYAVQLKNRQNIVKGHRELLLSCNPFTAGGAER